jgi:uncharacterized SAM-binding protein YcdF (DUF218 family)
MNRPRRCLVVVLLAGVLLAGLYAARSRLLPPLGRWLDVGYPPRPADYVIVLCGEENTRPFVAAALVKVGLAQKVLVAHVKASPDVEDGILPPAHEIVRRVLLRRGVAVDDIAILGSQVEHTHGEAQVLAAFLQSSPHARVTVVTSNYHTRRARWAFARVLGDRVGQVRFVSAPAYCFRSDNWWQSEKGVRTVVGEYMKLAFYGVRYGRLGHGAAAVCVTLVVMLLAYRWCCTGRPRRDSARP